MKKKYIILCVIGVLFCILLLDTLQARILNNKPIIKITEDYNGGTLYQKHKGILIDTYVCVNGKNKTVFKWEKYNCPTDINNLDNNKTDLNSERNCLENVVGGYITSNETPHEIELSSIIEINNKNIDYSQVKISDNGAIYVIVKTDDEDIIKSLDNYFSEKYTNYQSTKTNNNYYIYVYNGFNDFNLEDEISVCK